MKLPVEPQFVPAAAADPPDPDSVLQDSGSAPAAGSSPAPAPPQPTVNHLETSGRTTDEEKRKDIVDVKEERWKKNRSQEYLYRQDVVKDDFIPKSLCSTNSSCVLLAVYCFFYIVLTLVITFNYLK